MYRFFLLIFGFLLSCSGGDHDVSQLESSIQNGDIIFQTTSSRQCEAVQLATHSEYSHVGIIFQDDGEWMVYEAVQPVK